MKQYIFILLLCLSGNALAQNILMGQIYDKNDNEPVIGATLYIPHLEAGTVSDLDGYYQFSSLPSGTYEILISALGYASRTIKVTIPETGHLDIELAPSAIEMEEIIISTPFHQLQSQNVMKVERIAVEELERSGGINLTDGLTNVPGVESMTTGSGIGKPVIRGLSSNRVLVYTQGVRLENQQFGGEHGLGLSSSGVGSAEVIKGPASLLYGSDALGGVLYFNPEGYAQPDSTEVDAGLNYHGNTQGVGLNAGYKTSGENLRFLARGDYSSHSDYETGDGDRVTNSRFTEWDFKTGLSYTTEGYRGDLRYNYNKNEAGIPTEIGEQSTSKEMQLPYQETNNHIISLDNRFYFQNSRLDFKVGYTSDNRKEFEEPHDHDHDHDHDHGHEEEHDHPHSADEPALEMQLNTISYDLKYHLPKRGAFETIIGAQGMIQTNENLGHEVLIPDAVTTDFGILATTHFHQEKFDIQAGIRYDHRRLDSDAHGTEGTNGFMPEIGRSFNSFNGALGAKFDLFPKFSTRINLATGFRAPNLAELSSHGSHHGSNRYEVGNPDLDTEQNAQLDVVLEYRNQHFEIFGNGFYNRINNYIYLSPTGEIMQNNPVFDYVQHDALLYGGEAGIHIHPHSYDWFHLESSFELVIGERSDGTALPLIPAPSLQNTLRIEYEDQDWIRDSYSFIGIKTHFDQNRVDEFETPSAGYTLFNAGVGGTLDIGGTMINLKVTGNNLLNKTYISHLSRLKPDGIANMGRSIQFGAKIFF